MGKKPKIFVAALHWGLGHASRCVPIIEELGRQGAEVLLGSDGQAAAFWSQTFPHLPLIELPSYGISYPTENMVWNMSSQLPRIYRAMRQERKICADIVQRYKINACINDSRFGLYSDAFRSLRSVFLCHQLQILAPNRILQAAIRWYNRRIINQYDECWVADDPAAPLAGLLADIKAFGLNNAEYIGHLSRLQPAPRREKIYDVLILLSGVEPQRAYLEKKLIEQAKLHPNKRFLLIKGQIKAENRVYFETPSLEVWDFALTSQLSLLLSQSKMLIVRAGYSTIMDLQSVGCEQALFIPTPAQTEQEYLAAYLQKQQIGLAMEQNRVDLAQAFAQIERFSGFEPRPNLLLSDKISRFLSAI